MTNEMKALAKTAPAPGLDMIRAPVPEIGPDDVLIRVKKTGICGTDIHIWDWDDWAAKTVPVPVGWLKSRYSVPSPSGRGTG